MIRHVAPPALSAIALLLALSPAPAAAQRSARVALTPGQVLFASPGVAHFQGGWIDGPTMTVTVDPRGNGNWDLYLRSSSPSLGGYGKPLSTLLWRTDAIGWTEMSTGDQLVASGAGTQDVLVYFRILLDWAADVPDTYGAVLDFTAIDR